MIKNIHPFEINYQGTPIQKVMAYKYLGMTLDSQLNYKLHVTKMISSVSGKLKQFQRMRGFLDTKAAMMVYKGMLLPLLEYGDIFLSATTADNRKKLQVLQNKGLRCALNRDMTESSEELHREANLLKLEYRREQHLLNFIYDWSHDPSKLKVKTKSTIQTRSQNKKLLHIRKPRTEKFKKSFAYQGPKKWNNLAHEFHQVASKTHYKQLISNLVSGRAQDMNQSIVRSMNLTGIG